MSNLIDRQAAIKTPLSASFENHDKIKSYSKDTISRQAAIDICDNVIDSFRGRFGAGVLVAIKESIEELPPAQPAELDTLIKALEQEHKKLLEMQKAQPEIVHCKDCKNWIPYDWMFSETWQSQNMDDYPQDEIGCSCCDMAMKADDFCSRAERRTDEE